MATKELGRSAATFSAVRFFALALGVSTLVVALSANTAHAQPGKKARDKIVELNKQALLSFEAKDFETAKDLLNKALKEAKSAGLEDDKMTARTYLHLGAVYWVGFQDQSVAIQNFTIAKKIRPDIQLTPSIETADLKSVFDLAVVEAEPTPPPEPKTTSSRPQTRTSAPAPSPRLSGSDSSEPDLPASMSAPLMCATPDTVVPSREVSIRCALKPGINAKSVQLHYRAPGAENYQAVPMRRTAKGWYVGIIPPHAVKGNGLQVYFDARDGSDNELASNGQVDSPSIIEIRKKSDRAIATRDKDDDPMRHIREQQRAEAYKAGLHRRMEGAFWLGVGAGNGWGYAPAGKLEWERNIQVSAITTTTGMMHLLPEVGYMWTDNFALAVQGRIEFIQQQQLSGVSSLRSGAPTQYAFAGFARAIWYTDVIDSGNLQFSFSGDLGAGFIRFPVKPVKVMKDDPNDPSAPQVLDENKSIAKTDTRPVGPVLAGASGGFIYHVSRHFALALEGRFITGLSNFGVVVEGGLSAQVGLGGGGAPPPSEDDEEEGGEGNGSAPGAPPSDAPSSKEKEKDEPPPAADDKGSDNEDF
jgi:hypothetical protein